MVVITWVCLDTPCGNNGEVGWQSGPHSHKRDGDHCRWGVLWFPCGRPQPHHRCTRQQWGRSVAPQPGGVTLLSVTFCDKHNQVRNVFVKCLTLNVDIKMFLLICDATIFIDNSNSGSPSTRSREIENVNLALKLYSEIEHRVSSLYAQSIILHRTIYLEVVSDIH